MSTKIVTVEVPTAVNTSLTTTFVFPIGQIIVSIGFEHSDIFLGNLYSNTVNKRVCLHSQPNKFHFIPEPISQWYILSWLGLRRGCKTFFVVFTAREKKCSAHGLFPVLWNSEFSVDNLFLKYCHDINSDFESDNNPARLIITLEAKQVFLIEELSISLSSSFYYAEDMHIDWTLVYFS